MKVIILRGISGSGKSMLKRNLMRDCGCDVVSVSADDFWGQGDDYKFDVTKIKEAHASCMQRYIQQLMKWAAYVEGHNPLLIVDNTNTRLIEVAPYYALADAFGAAVRIVTIVCDPHLAFASTQHNTSATILWAQHQRILTEQLPPWWKQEVAFRRVEVADCVAGDGQLDHEDGVVFDIDQLLEEMNP